MRSARPALAAPIVAALSIVAAVLPGIATADATAPTSILEERSRVRLRTVRVRFEPTRNARPGECRELGLDDLRVRLRGELLDRDLLVELERRREPTLHGLLIDTSGSMIGKLGHARRAATEYVRRLDPVHDRALVATFDESVILVHRPTADRDVLADAIGGIRMGAMTSMLDGLYYGIGELLVHRDRPVVVLLSDGVDTASLQEQDDIRRLAERRSDLIVFTIGYELPPLDSGGGVISTRKFLNRLAESTDGEFFDVPTGGRLDFVFRKIHEALENEALLTFLDPQPNAPLGKVRVRLPGENCRLHVYRTADDEESETHPDETADAGARIRLSTGPRERFLVDQAIHHRAEASCDDDRAASLDELWYAERGSGRIHGCALDVTMDTGLLYSHVNRSRVQHNGWVQMSTRPFELRVPPIADLPTTPAVALDALARGALAVAGNVVETDSRMRPAERHARPWDDIPAIVNGRTLLHSREALARSLYGYPEYRDWAQARMAVDVEAELAALRDRFARLAPAASPEAVEQAVRLSDEGQRIASRADAPTAADLQRNLGAWLGDVSAYRLFIEWEVQQANDLLADDGDDAFVEHWQALRRLFFVPSYARVLGVLSPVHDVASDRIGFWRVVLPRPGWLQPRLKDANRHPEWRDLPLDLVPDRPLGVEVLRESLARDPTLRVGLVAGTYRVTAIRYELLGKPHRQDPRHAYRDARIELSFASSTAAPALRIAARVRLDRNGTVRVDELELPAGFAVASLAVSP